MRRTSTSTTHPRLAAAAAFLLCTARAAVAADNLACSGTGMDWYINMVGETPCQTYQKLRQICNAQYAVGVQNTNTPPDSCSDQVSTCCCNTVAFSLSMLCLNCQQPIGNGTGYDAGVGAYQDYLGSCSNPQSFKLPTDIQTAVCNEKIKIANDIYSNGWGDGSWFYIFTRDTITKDNIVANNNSFTHCASTTLNTSSSASNSNSVSATKSASSGPAPAATSNADTASTTTKKIGTGAIAGIAVGVALVGLAAAAALWWFCYYRRRHGGRAGALEEPLGYGGAGAGAGGRASGGAGGGMRERERVDESLVAHGYTYTSSEHEPATTASDYFDASRSEGGTSSSAPGAGFTGLGAASAVGYGYGQGTPPLTSPRRGFHTAGQPSTSSSASLPATHADASMIGSGSGSGSSEARRPQAGPLPRKRGARANAQAGGSGSGGGQGQGQGPAPGRRDSAEPFLEEEEGPVRDHAGWLGTDGTSERHQDGGPVSDVSLGRSASGRLPPAYGEQL